MAELESLELGMVSLTERPTVEFGSPHHESNQEP